jgi:hypothetical protein
MTYLKKTVEQKRLNKMNEIIQAHGDIYLFDKFEYVAANNFCTLICKLCGNVLQTNISSIKHKSNTCCKECNVKFGLFKQQSIELMMSIKIEYEYFAKQLYDISNHAKVITNIGDNITKHLSTHNSAYKLVFKNIYFNSISNIFKENELEYLIKLIK